MSILSGVYEPSEDIVSIDQFNRFNDLQKGCFFIRQYLGLLRTFAFKSKPSGINLSIPYWEEMSRTHPLVNQFVEHLQSFYSAWSNTIDRTSDLSLKIFSIVQWLHGDVKIPLNVSYQDLLFFAEMVIPTDANNERSRCSYKDCPVIASFFMVSRMKSLIGTGDVRSYDDFALHFKENANEVINIEKPIIYYPYIYVNNETEDTRIILEQMSGLFSFSITYEKLFPFLYNSPLEITLRNSIGKHNDVDFIFRTLSLYNIGYDYWNENIGGISSENVIITAHNCMWGVNTLEDWGCNQLAITNSSIGETIKKICDTYGLIIERNTTLYNVLQQFGFFDELKVTESEVQMIGVASIETLTLLQNTDRLLYQITMEDEEPTEEIKEDNIDSEQPTETDNNEDPFADQPTEDNSDSFGGGDDIFGSSSSGGFGSSDDVNTITVPKNTNIDTNSKKGTKIELDVNPTFDSVMTKEELVVLINNYLNDAKLSTAQKTILTSIKNMWMGLVSVRTIIDWMELTLKQNVFKKN